MTEKIKKEPLEHVEPVTVNDKTADFMHFDEEKTLMVKSEFTDELARKKRLIYVHGKEKYQPETKRVSKRVKYLSDNQIRKEYGIMQKPFEKTGENIIWVMQNKGPVTTTEIAQELGVSYGKISGVVSELYAFFSKTGDIVRETRGTRGYEYLFGSKYSPQVAWEMYLDSRRRKKKTVTPSVTETEAPKQGAYLKPVAKMAKDLLGTAIPREVQINVSVEVLFGIKKG